MSPAGCRILFMDDDAGIRDVVRVFLGSLGYRVEVAENGESAIEIYREAMQAGDPFSIVILDLSVTTGRGGIETLQEIKTLEPGVKAIITSGFTGDPIFSRFREHGFVAALPKPFHIRDLNEIIQSILSSRSSA